MDHALDTVIADSNAPALVGHSVVGADSPSVADAFHGVAAQRAAAVGAVACAHEDGVSCLAKVVAPSHLPLLMKAEIVARRDRQTQPGSCHCLGRCFKRDARQTKREAEQTAHCAPERVSRNPDVGVWIQRSDIVVEILRSVVVSVLVPQRGYHTGAVAGECARLAVAHLLPQILAPLSTAA